MDATDELSAPDDRTQFRLKRPFPHLPQTLAGPGGNAPVIMPERLAVEATKIEGGVSEGLGTEGLQTPRWREPDSNF
jgi:peptide/nickel transport system substrate-binding protein